MKKTLISIICLVCAILPMSAQDFTFALLTDTHISKHNSAPAEDLNKVVTEINNNPKIEFVIVSGDLSEEGDFTSLSQAKAILAKLNKPYYAVLGNHETKWTESGMTDFGKIFGSERVKFEHKGFLFLGFNTGPLLRMADGHVVPQDISWLEKELSEAPINQPTFLITHYPLLKGDVDNWYDVTNAVRKYNIKSFLGGHYHSNRFFQYDGIPGIISRSTLRDKDNNPGYTLIDVVNDSLYVSEKKINQAPIQWKSLSLTEKYYTKESGNDIYPDFSVNNEYPLVKKIWMNKSGVGIYSSPALYKKNIYVGDDMGYLSAYRIKDGKKLWQFKAEHRILGTPEADNNVVVFGAADKHIYGLNANNGKLLWKIKANAPVLGAVTIHNNIAFIGASDGVFRAIDILSGNIVWQYNQVKGYVETKPLVTDNKVIFGAWDNTLYALNEQTGEVEWLWTGDIKGMHFSPAAVWPVAAHGKVFITDPKRAMTAISLQSGETIWRTNQSMVRETIGLSEDNQRIYSKTMNDSVVCYSAETDIPEHLWSTDVGFGYEHAPSMPIEKEGVLYGSTKNGLMFALNSTTGQIIWKHKVGNSLINTLVPLDKNRVLFTATGGEIGLLEYKNK